MTPRGMKSFADFMFKIGRIKRNPANWQEMFFSETAQRTEADGSRPERPLGRHQRGSKGIGRAVAENSRAGM